jgi:hypothetical protein
MWLARGALAALVPLLLILKLWAFRVSAVSTGTTTVYSSPPLLPIISGAFGIVIGIGAVVFWMQPGLFFRLVAVALAFLALSALFNAPTGLNHRLVVTPDYFHLRLGPWYAPVDTQVEFGSLAYVALRRTRDGAYELQAFTNGGSRVSVPVCDIMRKALPEILQRAAQRSVVIGEGADGLQIPAALRE